MNTTQKMVPGSKHRPCIGLALSGGGPRGLAHIGVLRVLEREGIPVDVIAGTSIGGVIAAGYAVGFSPDDLEKEAMATARVRRLLRLIDPGLPEAGILRGQRLQAYFEELLGAVTFADLKVPLALVAVDLNAQQETILTEGSVSLALRATISVPGLFTPVEIDGQRLVDGGLLDNLPVDAAQELGADVVIAVDVESDPNRDQDQRLKEYGMLPNGLASTLAIVDEASQLMMSAIKQSNLMQIGEEAAEEKLPLIRQLLSQHRSFTASYIEPKDEPAL